MLEKFNSNENTVLSYEEIQKRFLNGDYIDLSKQAKRLYIDIVYFLEKTQNRNWENSYGGRYIELYEFVKEFLKRTGLTEEEIINSFKELEEYELIHIDGCAIPVNNYYALNDFVVYVYKIPNISRKQFAKQLTFKLAEDLI